MVGQETLERHTRILAPSIWSAPITRKLPRKLCVSASLPWLRLLHTQYCSLLRPAFCRLELLVHLEIFLTQTKEPAYKWCPETVTMPRSREELWSWTFSRETRCVRLLLAEAPPSTQLLFHSYALIPAIARSSPLPLVDGALLESLFLASAVDPRADLSRSHRPRTLEALKTCLHHDRG